MSPFLKSALQRVFFIIALTLLTTAVVANSVAVMFFGAVAFGLSAVLLATKD